jgi:hypothetical protein
MTIYSLFMFIYQLNMVIWNSYLSLPEGKYLTMCFIVCKAMLNRWIKVDKNNFKNYKLEFLLLDEGAATDNNIIHFVFQSLVGCWLLNRTSTSCWLFILLLTLNYSQSNTQFPSNFPNTFETWCRWWLVGFIFRVCFPE